MNLEFAKNFPKQCCLGEEEHGASDQSLTPDSWLTFAEPEAGLAPGTIVPCQEGLLLDIVSEAVSCFFCL